MLTTDIHDYVKERTIRYGKYSLQDRAIPEFRDGLKPIHRRLLWTAYVGGFHSNGPTKKSARLVGDAIGKFSPNGDQPVYGALVTMVNSPNPLFIGQGNFGDKVTEDEESAYRYTEVKLSPFAEKYLLDKDYLACIPMVPNYDGTLEEPGGFLPAKIPLLLTQNIEGIGVGASTNIPSFSLESVKDLTLQTIKKGKCTSQMCIDTLDFKFSEGGKVYSSEKELQQFFKKGEAKLFVAPIFEYDKKLHALVMTTYCPRLKLHKAMEIGLTVDGVRDVENASGKNKKKNKIEIRVLFYLKKIMSSKDDIKKIEKALVHAIGNIMPYSIMVTDRADGKVENFSFTYSNIPDIVNKWLEWRLDFEKKVVERLVKIEKEKKQKLLWLMWAIDHLELVFKALKTKNPDEFLVKKGKITEEHAKYILDGVVRRLSKLSKVETQEKIKVCEKTIKEYTESISTRKNIAKRVYKDLKKLEG